MTPRKMTAYGDKKRFGVGALALVALILSPLVYSFDGDPYRSYEVLAMAAFGGAVLLVGGLRGRSFGADIVPLAVFCMLLVLQQFGITGASVPIGIQYAVVLSAMFVPALAIRAHGLHFANIGRSIAFAVNALFVIAVSSIYVSFFSGIGEIHDGVGMRRAFGWLGDSFTPVIVFLILYFIFEKRWLRAALSLGALIVTGGKAGAIMLAAMPALHVLASPASPVRKLGVTFVAGLAAGMVFMVWDEITGLFPSGFEYSYNARLLSIEFGIQYFLEDPWFGKGINQSMQVISVETEYFINNFGIRSHLIGQIHNAFVRTAAETGIFGLAALLAMCAIWISSSLRILSHAYRWRNTSERSIAMAGALWAIGFILLYQTTGWFEAGHPQLAWLLMIMAVSEAVYLRARRAQAVMAARAVPARAAVALRPVARSTQ